MWELLTGSIAKVFSSWIDLKKSKNESEAAYHRQALTGEQDWDIEAQKQAQYSWKDEFITLVWFAPLIMAWWDPVRAQNWIDFVTGLPYWYQFGMFGIIASSFGLRWYFKSQAFNLKK